MLVGDQTTYKELQGAPKSKEELGWVTCDNLEDGWRESVRGKQPWNMQVCRIGGAPEHVKRNGRQIGYQCAGRVQTSKRMRMTGGKTVRVKVEEQEQEQEQEEA